MAFAVIIPVTIVGLLGIVGYLAYRYVIFDYLSNKSVNDTLRRYNIDKSQFDIVKEYYEHKGESIPIQEIHHLVKFYRQKEPEQFLAMYDSVREKSRTD
jgi:hypothetical protein